jgi:predicted CoA-substrate-specific enzyme activase
MTQYCAGIDIGSTMTKVVIMNDTIITSLISTTSPEHRKLANKAMEEALFKANLQLEDINYIVATGYGRINVPFADKQITEISCHAKGVSSLIPSAHTIIDIGGQDCKGIRINNSKVLEFVMNDKCAAGTGRFLEIIAESLGVKLENIGELSLTAKKELDISNTCTVFAQQEVTNKLAEGASVPDLLFSIHKSIANRIYGMVSRLKIQPAIVVTGGGAKNIGLVKALEIKLGQKVIVPPEPLLTGAIGAALFAREEIKNLTEKGLPTTRNRTSLQETTFFI